jgi:hypothetical protein
MLPIDHRKQILRARAAEADTSTLGSRSHYSEANALPFLHDKSQLSSSTPTSLGPYLDHELHELQVETLLSNHQIRFSSLTNLFCTHHSPRLTSHTMDEEYDVR